MHALIVGPPGNGKSELIRRVLAELNRPLFGYETRKEDALADEEKGSPIYIYDAACAHQRSEENLVGYCKNRHATVIRSAFDRYAPRLLGAVPEGSVIALDEIGFMEAKSEPFCEAVLALLDGNIPVIAAVRDKDAPFLQTVRSHPKARCFHVTPDNQEALYHEILEFMKTQLEETR